MNDFELEFVMGELGYDCEVVDGKTSDPNKQKALDRVKAAIDSVDKARKQLKAKGIDADGNILLEKGGKLLSGCVIVSEEIAGKARKKGWKISKRFNLSSFIAIERKAK